MENLFFKVTQDAYFAFVMQSISLQAEILFFRATFIDFITLTKGIGLPC
jgi:hypothetical protein